MEKFCIHKTTSQHKLQMKLPSTTPLTIEDAPVEDSLQALSYPATPHSYPHPTYYTPSIAPPSAISSSMQLLKAFIHLTKPLKPYSAQRMARLVLSASLVGLDSRTLHLFRWK
ncbi:hypothetical protein VNI00_016074 [Paramarasmius palmivorus]|uniref:Uncharacterized protein n=1 Tax=Paramarasmius palmivorus TaxID=297713 RepID=A0AAW0BHT5_9AGAR